jgi:uncharacterized protein
MKARREEQGMVAEIIEQKKDEIAALCQKHGVRALWVFGSAATGAFDPKSSDLDLLVDLGGYTKDYADRFFSMRRGLVDIFHRSVDLLSVGGLDDQDDWFRQKLEATRVTLYEAGHDRVVA